MAWVSLPQQQILQGERVVEAAILLPWQTVVGVKGRMAEVLVMKGFPMPLSRIEETLIRLPPMVKFRAEVQIRLSLPTVARVPQKSTAFRLRARALFRWVPTLPCRFSVLVPSSRVAGKALFSPVILQFSRCSVTA